MFRHRIKETAISNTGRKIKSVNGGVALSGHHVMLEPMPQRDLTGHDSGRECQPKKRLLHTTPYLYLPDQSGTSKPPVSDTCTQSNIRPMISNLVPQNKITHQGLVNCLCHRFQSEVHK